MIGSEDRDVLDSSSGGGGRRCEFWSMKRNLARRASRSTPSKREFASVSAVWSSWSCASISFRLSA